MFFFALHSLKEDIPVAILLSFASEGNNAEDGMALAKCLNSWLNLVHQGQFKMPPSWDALFGGPAPISLYN